ncbi:MAG: universal stress protein [Candidatus Kapaibacterium sp.]
MATPTFNSIGFCAHYSNQGDWAFKYALGISKKRNLKLNVFHFLEDPYDPADISTKGMSHNQREKLAVEKEKKLRIYYDSLAEDYLNVGFRVCYDKEWTELHRCLLIREFQLLVLGYPGYGAFFGHRHIEEFAEKFISPVILVGPDSPYQYFLNNQAFHMVNQLDLHSADWSKLEVIAT